MARKPSGTATAARKPRKKPAERPGDVVASANPAAGLTPVEWHALAQAAKEAKPQRANLAIGEGQPVDLTIRILGQVDVCPASTETKRVKPSIEDLLTALFACTPAAERNALAKKVTKGCRAIAKLKVPAGVKETVGNILAALTTQEKQPKQGAVTGAVTVELIARARG